MCRVLLISVFVTIVIATVKGTCPPAPGSAPDFTKIKSDFNIVYRKASDLLKVDYCGSVSVKEENGKYPAEVQSKNEKKDKQDAIKFTLQKHNDNNYVQIKMGDTVDASNYHILPVGDKDVALVGCKGTDEFTGIILSKDKSLDDERKKAVSAALTTYANLNIDKFTKIDNSDDKCKEGGAAFLVPSIFTAVVMLFLTKLV